MEIWRRFSLVGLCLLLAACESESASETDGGTTGGDQYVLASIVITEEGRTLFVQVLDSLDVEGRITNDRALEISGHGVILVRGRDVFIGHVESPEWVRYTVQADGSLQQTGRLSLAAYGWSAIDYGNAIVDDDLAVSVSTESLSAIFWNPTTMEVVGELELPHIAREGYESEVWSTIAHNGRVYVPTRWANWEDGRVYPGVMMTIIDAHARTIVGIAEDDRCASGGRIVFDADGYGYVMGDGRNYSIQMYAHSRGEEIPTNCLLRIPPGGTDFEEDWYVEIRSLTGGLESATELDFVEQGTGIAFTKLFYPDELPEGVEPVDFDFWGYPAFRMWRLELGDEPRARPVDGTPFGALGFDGSRVDGRLFSPESPDHSTSVVYEIDPTTGTAQRRFEMDGLFNALARIPAN